MVGHDWGGIVAWWLAVTRPERVSRLVILNAPHPVVMRRALRTDPLQMLRSWYVFMMQIPWLTEWTSRWWNWRSVVRALRTSSRPGTFTDEDFARYREAWWRPGAYRSMVNWYRAALRSPPGIPADVRVHVPTLMLWGAKDKFIRPKYAERLAAFETGMLGPVFAALETQDRGAFDRAFAVATENANLQHVETGYGYIRWTLPKDPPQDMDLGPTK